MWFKMGGQRIEEAVAEAPPVPAVAGAPAMVDTGLGGGFPARPAETPAADMAQTLRNNLADSAIRDAAKALPDPSPAPIGVADRSSVDALNAAAQGLQDEITAHQNPAVQVDLNPGPGFGTNIIDATGSTSAADKKPWAGGRRPKGATAADSTLGTVSDPTDTLVGTPTAQTPEGLDSGSTAVVGDAGATEVSSEAEGSGGSVVENDIIATEGDSAGAAVAAEVASQITGTDSGNPAEAPTVEVTTGDGEDNDGTSGNFGVAIPRPGETYPGMQAPMPDMWTKPAGDPVINPNPDAGVATPAPRELTQEERDAETDSAEAAAEREKIIQEGLGDANTEPVSPNAGDQIEPSNTAARDSVLTSEATDQLRTDGVIKTEDGSEVIDATNTPPTDQVIPVTPEAPAQEPATATDEVVTDPSAPETPVDSTGITQDPPVEEADGARADSDINIMAEGEDDTDKSAPLEPVAQGVDSAQETLVTSSATEEDKDLQERAQELAGKPIREAVDVLKNTDLNERQVLIEELASAVVFKQMESEGISNVIDIKDPNGLADRINGMTKLFELWVKESRSRISNITSDEKVVSFEEPEASSAQSVPADTTQAA